MLGPQIGETIARAATNAHCRNLGIDERVVKSSQLELLLERLRSGLVVFIGRARAAEVIEEARQALAIAREEIAR